MLDRLLRRTLGGRGLARRIYFAFLAAAAIPTGIAGIIGVTLSVYQLREETLRHLGQEVSVRANGVSLFFNQLSAELRYLAEAPALAELRSAIRQGDNSRTRAATQRLEHDYSALASTYPHIYQIRFLSRDGQERVRVDRRGHDVVVVSKAGLQDKSDRYYFREAVQLEPGSLYVSPLDLNVEFGRIETPERPVVRVAVALGERGERTDSILVVNLDADILLAQIEQMAVARSGTAYLFDRSGHFLSRSREAASGFAMKSVDVLKDVFGASHLAAVVSGREGTMMTGQRIVAYAPVEFGAAYPDTKGGRWVIAVDVAQQTLFFSIVNLYVLYAVLVVAMIVTAIGGYALSRRLLGPVDALAQETEAIAGGDFTRRVSISGDDEIADLGTKFNAMTDRLSELYGKLAAHRDRLEDEVGARTRELVHERAWLAAIIQHTGDGILVVGEDGDITLANGAARELLGFHADVAGARLAEFWSEWPGIAVDVADDMPTRRDLKARGRVLALSITSVRDVGGGRSFVVVARDISEERRLQDERRELDRQMFQMDKMATMGELAMGLAHEIGNPLAGMKAVAQALQYEEDLPPGVFEALRRLEGETDRLSDFLRTFHGFAAPTTPDLRATPLGETLADILFWTRKEARNQKVEITTHIPDVLPPLRADPAQLKQVLLNLVINALRAQPDGGSVDIAAEADGGRVRIDVRDSGSGIPETLQRRIFEPFFTTREGGSGLGLSIVHKIVQEHGAEIAVSSDGRHGSCFTLLWPIHSASGHEQHHPDH
ncbi:PAS domain-containing sensor histidine kinase [Aromatoleum toluvorans]|uniref:PAS domain-containing sensor histidine kinase n=1 Tax=Aromatoleum toluvorans TaxID=92002 RepID=UPI00145E84D7|nr:PAS domain-containing sensor histidine kinase [Aromatoleum toluvorans]